MSSPKKPRTGRLHFDGPKQTAKAKPAKPAERPAQKPAPKGARKVESAEPVKGARESAEPVEGEAARNPFQYRKDQRSIYIDKELHQDAKLLATRQGKTLRDYVEVLIRNDLNAHGIYHES